MRQYWVKNSVDDDADGPIDAAELRRRVAAGQLSRDALISVDHAAWYRAERMKGLTFPDHEGAVEVAVEEPPPMPKPRRPIQRSIPPTYPAMAAPPAQQHIAPLETVHREVPAAEVPVEEVAVVEAAPDAPAAEAESHPIEATPFHEEIETLTAPAPAAKVPAVDFPPPPLEPLAPPPIEAPAKRSRPATPMHAYTPHVPIKPRSVTTYWLLAAAVFVLVGFIQYFFAIHPIFKAMSKQDELILQLAAGALFLVSMATLVVWLIWLNRAHHDMSKITGGRYPISPEKAIGLSFVPLFNIFWSVRVPSEMCGELNHHLRAAGLAEVPRGLVKTCHILGIILFLAMPGLTAIMYGVSMSKIQGGLNRLAQG